MDRKADLKRKIEGLEEKIRDLYDELCEAKAELKELEDYEMLENQGENY